MTLGSFTLSYHRGSFPMIETLRTLDRALDRADAVLDLSGCSNLEIAEDGNVLLFHAQIVGECRPLMSSQQGRMPSRAS